jgi:hypothetical protein
MTFNDILYRHPAARMIDDKDGNDLLEWVTKLLSEIRPTVG